MRIAGRVMLPLLVCAAGAADARGDEPRPRIVSIDVVPARIQLRGVDAQQSLLVTGVADDGSRVDLTREAAFDVDDAWIAAVTERGIVTSIVDGRTTARIVASGCNASVPITVSDTGSPRPTNFRSDVVPILSRLGCNSGECHGKAEGQNGFKLSVFGSDSDADYDAIVQAARGRRVMAAAPHRSLLLQKPLSEVPHGGGQRLHHGSREHRALLRWLAAGTPRGRPHDPVVEHIEVAPSEAIVRPRHAQQLQVTAHLSDGTRRDVTFMASYRSNVSAVAGVSNDGLVRARRVPGEAAITASYAGHVSAARLIVPQRLAKPFRRPPEANFIDGLVWDKLERLGIQPSGPCSDETFLRRVYLDVIGTLPTTSEARRFLASDDPQKRRLLVDELLSRPEFADYWALKWADLLRIDRLALQAKGAFRFYQWIRQAWKDNMPYDTFVRRILTAQGRADRVGPVNLYRMLDTPEKAASTISQVFLGVRIECAQCHHHPTDKWSQDDFYGMAAFFAHLQRSSRHPSAALSAGPPVVTRHPKKGYAIAPRPLEGSPPAVSADPRAQLADWLASPDNRWFSRAIANRMWAHFAGRGLVEPVDDLRDTNPASNGPLLDALAQYVARQRFDLKQLIRVITESRVYQLSSRPNHSNAGDAQNFSRAALKPIEAEVLLDAVSHATGRPEPFPLWPDGTRAIELWDNRIDHYFLKVFGRPLRVTSCECERVDEPSIAQVLHLMNGPEIQAKIVHHEGRVHRLLDGDATAGRIVEELYLATYARLPTPGEHQVATRHLVGAGDARRRRAAEDLLWALINSTEFLFNH